MKSLQVTFRDLKGGGGLKVRALGSSPEGQAFQAQANTKLGP